MIKFLLGGLATILIAVLMFKATIVFFVLLALGFIGGAIAKWNDDKYEAVGSIVAAVLVIVLIKWLVS